jgi:hypothetical protein
MSAHYRHTQVGWAILAFTAALALLLAWRLPAEAWPVARFPLLFVAAILLLGFSALAVEVDGEAVRLRFGAGLVRRRVPLADVSGWRAVRNPWYTGWGIRLGPGWVLWNVSGRDAVELDLPGGRRFRVGTDEPDALVAAITRAKGVAAPPASGSSTAQDSRATWLVPALLLVVLAAVVGWLFWNQVQPPTVTVSAGGFEVETPYFGRSFPAAEVTGVSLEPTLPRVLLRTSGFAGAGSLRGRFRLEGMGEGRLYVDEGFAPYVLVRLREGYVFLNFREPERTRALYEDLARAFPDKVGPPPARP